MNAAKRKAESAPAGLAARMLPFLRQPYRRLFVVLLLAAGLTGGAYYGWQRVGPQVTQGSEYLLEPDQIEITPPPPWIRSDVRGETIRDGGLSGLSILDRELTVKIARAFSMHTWVEDVRRVRKEHPARVVVDLAYRRPVAMVEVTMNDRPGLLPVDVNGVLLPPGDFSAEQARDYLRVSLADATPAGPVGTPWGDPRVDGAADRGRSSGALEAIGTVSRGGRTGRTAPGGAGRNRVRPEHATRGANRLGCCPAGQ